MSCILLLDPDAATRRTGAAALRHGGFEVELAGSLDRALHRLRRASVSAVVAVVDPQGGASSVGRLRLGTDTPILVISSRATEIDKVEALDAGADDYLTRPYGVEELLARLRALLRRSAVREERRPIVTDDFTLDVGARRLWRPDGQEILLTAVEWRVLEVLLRAPGHLVPREELLAGVWGPRGLREPHYLRVYVSRLRRKLEPDPHRPRYLITVPGLGTFFAVDGGRHPDHTAERVMMEV